jgi:acetylornithine deacetylase/succinyl-diaminopimelate desuccinylase-like protein
MSDGNGRLLHTTESTVRIEVPQEVAAEVALRTAPNASRTQVRDYLAGHITHDIEYVTPDGRDAIDVILNNDRRL